MESAKTQYGLYTEGVQKKGFGDSEFIFRSLILASSFTQFVKGYCMTPLLNDELQLTERFKIFFETPFILREANMKDSQWEIMHNYKDRLDNQPTSL